MSDCILCPTRATFLASGETLVVHSSYALIQDASAALYDEFVRLCERHMQELRAFVLTGEAEEWVPRPIPSGKPEGRRR